MRQKSYLPSFGIGRGRVGTIGEEGCIVENPGMSGANCAVVWDTYRLVLESYGSACEEGIFFTSFCSHLT
ncbi:hypothetical protein Mapa_005804 [Marchantia paleacea]|nr:hypothetical protein Mapa_005804 [Marchantia paleacea]